MCIMTVCSASSASLLLPVLDFGYEGCLGPPNFLLLALRPRLWVSSIKNDRPSAMNWSTRNDGCKRRKTAPSNRFHIVKCKSMMMTVKHCNSSEYIVHLERKAHKHTTHQLTQGYTAGSSQATSDSHVTTIKGSMYVRPIIAAFPTAEKGKNRTQDRAPKQNFVPLHSVRKPTTCVLGHSRLP
jgi:hypothetical protein